MLPVRKKLGHSGEIPGIFLNSKARETSKIPGKSWDSIALKMFARGKLGLIGTREFHGKLGKLGIVNAREILGKAGEAGN